MSFRVIKVILSCKGAFTSDTKQRLATFASGRVRHLLKFGLPFKNNSVQVKLSNHSRSLRPVETVCTLSKTSNFSRLASSVNAINPTTIVTTNMGIVWLLPERLSALE